MEHTNKQGHEVHHEHHERHYQPRPINWILGFALILFLFFVLFVIKQQSLQRGLNYSASSGQLDTTSLTKNGNQIAYLNISKQNSATTGDVWVMNPDGANKVQISFDGQISDIGPWSPDNQYITVFRQLGNNHQLAVVVFDSGLLIPLADNISISKVSWLSNHELVYQSGDNGQTFQSISLPEKETSTIASTPITTDDNVAKGELFLSPDSRSVAFLSHPNNLSAKITVFDIGQNQRTDLPVDGATKVLGWYGSDIAFQLDDQGQRSVRRINPKTHVWQQLLKLDNSHVKEYLSLDDQQVAAMIIENDSSMLDLVDIVETNGTKVQVIQNNDLRKQVSHLSLSDDLQYFAYTTTDNTSSSANDNLLISVRIDTDKSQDASVICTTNCFQPNWLH